MNSRRVCKSPLFVTLCIGALALVFSGCSNLPQQVLAPEETAGQNVNPNPAEKAFVWQLAPQQRSSKLLGGVLDSDLGKTVTYTADALVLNPNSKVEFDSDIFQYGYREDLWVKFGLYSDYLAGDIQILEAELRVGSRSVPRESGKVKISMEAHSGTSMRDINIIFEPHGFDFDPNYQAKLKLTLVGKDVPETRGGYHHHEPDDVEKIEVSYREYNGILMKVVVITIKVPGFSSYSLAGDDESGYSEEYSGDDGYGDEDDTYGY